MLKDGYCFDSEMASLSLCLSVFGTEENGHIEPTGVPVFQRPLGFTCGLFCQQ